MGSYLGLGLGLGMGYSQDVKAAVLPTSAAVNMPQGRGCILRLDDPQRVQRGRCHPPRHMVAPVPLSTIDV